VGASIAEQMRRRGQAQRSGCAGRGKHSRVDAQVGASTVEWMRRLAQCLAVPGFFVINS